jgi:hypothetical protein
MRKLLIAMCILLLPIKAVAVVSITVIPTSDTVLPGSVRSLYPDVEGDTNVAVTWSASEGTVEAYNGYATWTAPAAPGVYTVTATSVVDPTKSASTTFTVIGTATVKLSHIPAQATIFKGQPAVIQSVLWGSTDTAVIWSSSGGSLAGTGREVTFTAYTPGTYTVTSTSHADPSKTATTAIVVTSHSWPATATANKTMPIDCTATGNGSTYEVTSGTEMDLVPWSSLKAGDTVRIHSGTYHKQILISTSGSEAQPIRVCGIADATGNLPVIDGANATAKAGANFGSGLGDLQMYGGIIIYDRNAGYYAGAAYPMNIIIEGLKITGFNSNNTYTDLSTGLVTNYIVGAAPIRVQHGGNITIRGNELAFNSNGLFTMSKNGVESGITRNLLVEGNFFHDNGTANDYKEHQSYLQSFGLVVQGNHYGTPLPGMMGGQLKTRSVQQFIRYNFFEPAARMIDLVEIQDSPELVFPSQTLDPKELVNTTPSDVVANNEAYQNRFVYGNILHNATNTTAWWVHGAGDNTQSANPGGTLYFYNNTIWAAIDGGNNWRSGLIDLGPYGDAATASTVWPSTRLTNNAIWLQGLTTRLFFWNRYMADRVKLDRNWITKGWGTGNLAGGDGTGIASTKVAAANVWQGGQLTTQVVGLETLLTGSSIPYDAASYVPTSGGPLINASVTLPGLAASLPPLMQYSPITHLMTRRATYRDIGAVGSVVTRPTGVTGTVK